MADVPFPKGPVIAAQRGRLSLLPRGAAERRALFTIAAQVRFLLDPSGKRVELVVDAKENDKANPLSAHFKCWKRFE